MAFRSAVVTQTTNALSTSGLSAVAGDRLFAVYSTDDNNAITVLSGWSQVGTQNNLTNDGQIAGVFELIGGITAAWIASPPASYTFTNGANSDPVGILWTMSGRGSGQQIAQTSTNSAAASPITMAMTGVTASALDDLVAINWLDSFSGTASFAAATWGGTGTFTARGTGNR